VRLKSLTEAARVRPVARLNVEMTSPTSSQVYLVSRRQLLIVDGLLLQFRKHLNINELVQLLEQHAQGGYLGPAIISRLQGG
jgi:hypothetical protein